VDDAVEAGPERVGTHAGTGQGLLLDEVPQERGDLKPADSDAIRHDECLPELSVRLF